MILPPDRDAERRDIECRRSLSERSSKREEGGNLSATTEHEDGMKGCVSDLR